MFDLKYWYSIFGYSVGAVLFTVASVNGFGTMLTISLVLIWAIALIGLAIAFAAFIMPKEKIRDILSETTSMKLVGEAVVTVVYITALTTFNQHILAYLLIIRLLGLIALIEMFSNK